MNQKHTPSVNQQTAPAFSIKGYLYTFAVFTAAIFIGFPSATQELKDYFRNDSIKVEVFGIDRKHPWAGGFNLPQFSPIDLNNDGFDDLFVFDRDGGRIYTFLNDGIQGTASFTYAPEFEKFFPNLVDWVKLRDYNCDGKPDIFTRANPGGGVSVYKNVSPGSANDSLAFELSVFQLPATYYGNMSLASVNFGDVPDIYDVDGDGDLDILAHHSVNTQVTWFENVTDTCADTLMFKFHSECYGGFFESLQTNQIVLEDSFCMSLKEVPFDPGNLPPHLGETPGHSRNTRHVGGTLCAFDPNNDGLPDLLIGDTEMSNMKAVFNTGTPTDAYMTSQDSTWPNTTVPVLAPHKPAAFLFDVNNDGLQDILVSPSEEQINEDVNNVLLYTNIGDSSNMQLSYTRNNFINRQSIDHGTGSYPRLIDVDGDGLLDILIGNTGFFDSFNPLPFWVKRKSQLAYFKNAGTPQMPSFEFVTNDFSNLGQYEFHGMYPAFGDLTGNGVPDMIAGAMNGRLNYFQSNSPQGAPLNFVLTDSNFMNIQIDTYTHPTLYDLNGDGLLDIITGTYNGKIAYYQNKGTAQNPQFDDSPDKDTLGGINFRRPGMRGMVAPYFAPYPTDSSSTKLIVGTFNEGISIFEIPSDPVNGAYSRVDSLPLKASQATPVIANLGGDAAQEIIYGQLTGGLTYLQTHEHLTDTASNGDTLVTGACCLPDFTCEQQTDSACAALNGTYFGDDVSCDDEIVDCEEPANEIIGACCLPDNSCTVATDSTCLAMNGVFQGEGTKCEDDSINCDPNTSADLLLDKPGINIFPNPASTELNVNIKNAAGTMNIEIYSVTGQILLNTRANPAGSNDFTQKFDISEFPSGVYLIKITGEQISTTQKLIKR